MKVHKEALSGGGALPPASCDVGAGVSDDSKTLKKRKRQRRRQKRQRRQYRRYLRAIKAIQRNLEAASKKSATNGATFPVPVPMEISAPMPIASPIPIATPIPIASPIPIATPIPIAAPVPMTRPRLVPPPSPRHPIIITLDDEDIFKKPFPPKERSSPKRLGKESPKKSRSPDKNRPSSSKSTSKGASVSKDDDLFVVQRLVKRPKEKTKKAQKEKENEKSQLTITSPPSVNRTQKDKESARMNIVTGWWGIITLGQYEGSIAPVIQRDPHVTLLGNLGQGSEAPSFIRVDAGRIYCLPTMDDVIDELLLTEEWTLPIGPPEPEGKPETETAFPQNYMGLKDFPQFLKAMKKDA